MSKKAKIKQLARFIRILGSAFPKSFLDTLILCGRSICFSNFGEDLVLTRMFSLPEKGFYVDVGANHPILASNTLRLDLMGWEGLAIEPNPDLARIFSSIRPQCKIICCGIALTNGKMEYIRFDRSQCNTFDEAMAEFSKKRGAKEIGRASVQTSPLSLIFEEYVGNKNIDVMSVDVEGYELQALESNNWNRWRPSIILIEDHLPIGTSFEGSEVSAYLRAKDYFIVSRIHFTSIFIRSDRANELAW